MWQGPVGVTAVPEATFEALVCTHHSIAAHTITKLQRPLYGIGACCLRNNLFWDHAASVAQMLWSVATRDSF